MTIAGMPASNANLAGRIFLKQGGGLMATRSKSTAEKRRKEMARKEKQRLKAERRAQRKLDLEQGIVPADDQLEVLTEDRPELRMAP